MRTLASLEHYVVLSNDDEVKVHQYIPGTYGVAVAGGEAILRVETEYPWKGQIRVVVESAPEREFSLVARIPHWAVATSLQVNGEDVPIEAEDGWSRVS
jgi:DUF1680 family protein